MQEFWGKDTPEDEFLYVHDLDNTLVFKATLEDMRYKILVEPDRCQIINVISGEDLTIRTLNGKRNYICFLPSHWHAKVI